MRKACIVGIDHYAGLDKLNYCVRDAKEIADLLEKHPDGSSNFSIALLENTDTKDILEYEVKKLFECDSSVEIALFYFSGHGHLNDKLGGQLDTISSCLVSDESESLAMDKILNFANASKAQQRIIILDCCYAGAIGENYQTAFIESGVTVMASCSSREVSVEGEDRVQHGLFTQYFIEALNNRAFSPGTIYAYIDSKLKSLRNPWKQKPVFKANVCSFVELKNPDRKGEERLVRMMECGGDKLESVFGASISSTFASGVINYIQSLKPWEKDRIFNNLCRLYKQTIKDDSLKGHYIRQNCCYYIARFQNSASKSFINNVCQEEEEKSPFVLRGAYLGSKITSHYGKKMFLEYFKKVTKNPEWASINAGYHQCYYKDKLFDEGYYFDITIDSKKTLSVLIRRLESKERLLLPLEIFTLKYILMHSGKQVLSDAQNRMIDGCIKNKDTYNELSQKYLEELRQFLCKVKLIHDSEGLTEYYCNGNYMKKLLSSQKAEDIQYEYREKIYIKNDFYNPHEVDEIFLKNEIPNEEKKAYDLVNHIKDMIDFKEMESKLYILDIGCSLGYFIPAWKNILKENSIICSIRGIDMSSFAIEKGIRRYGKSVLSRCNVFEDEAIKLYRSKKWNIICCFDFLEHCFDVDLFLSRLRSNTPENLILIIYIPILEFNTDNMDNLENYRYEYVHHIYYFSEEGLKVMMERNGFKYRCNKHFEDKQKSLFIFDKMNTI